MFLNAIRSIDLDHDCSDALLCLDAAMGGGCLPHRINFIDD